MKNFGKFALALIVMFFVLGPLASFYGMMMSPEVSSTLFQTTVLTLGVLVGRWMEK